MAHSLADAASEILSAVSDALSADLRPVCKSYMALGTPVILNCCECDDGTNGELSIHVRRLYDAEANSLDEVRRIRPCKGGITAAQYRLVLARCRPILNEHGELPESSAITDAAEDQIRDMELLWQSLACIGFELRIDDVSVDLSDPGMCSVIFADITVAVQVPALPVSESG